MRTTIRIVSQPTSASSTRNYSSSGKAKAPMGESAYSASNSRKSSFNTPVMSTNKIKEKFISPSPPPYSFNMNKNYHMNVPISNSGFKIINDKSKERLPFINSKISKNSSMTKLEKSSSTLKVNKIINSKINTNKPMSKFSTISSSLIGGMHKRSESTNLFSNQFKKSNI